MSFLPKDYKSPTSTNNYMKIQEGENRIRILTSPVMGWEDWHDKKPVRYPMNQKPLKPYDSKKPARHFWAFIVWNYNEEQIQILNITQATIRNNLEALCNDEDWGSPFNYDIKIIKKGEGTDTEYTINPVPKKEIADYIKEKFLAKPCNLDSFFTGEDPFGNHPVYTKAFFQDDDEDIDAIISECSPDYQKTILDLLKRQNVKSVSDLPKESQKKIRVRSVEERELYKAVLNEKS